MSNKAQLQINNANLDVLIARVNAAKNTVASLPEASNPTDPNLIPENIKAGVTIFGVTGTYTGEGGNSLITFTLDGTEYQAEEGMTWGEWVESDYNTDGFQICEYNKLHRANDVDGVMFKSSANGTQKQDDTISNLETYFELNGIACGCIIDDGWS
jgi:hypothetical protein